MRAVDARVDDRDDDVRAPGGDRPRFPRVDVGVRRAGAPVHRLAEVVEAPEPRHERVVRYVRPEHEVGLGVGHAPVALEAANRLGGASWCDRYERAANPAEAAHAHDARVR